MKRKELCDETQHSSIVRVRERRYCVYWIFQACFHTSHGFCQNICTQVCKQTLQTSGRGGRTKGPTGSLSVVSTARQEDAKDMYYCRVGPGPVYTDLCRVVDGVEACHRLRSSPHVAELKAWLSGGYPRLREIYRTEVPSTLHCTPVHTLRMHDVIILFVLCTLLSLKGINFMLLWYWW